MTMSGSGRSCSGNRFVCLILFTLLILLISCSFSFFTSISYADEYHYNNIIIGDRAAGMGGAYTSVSDDPSGLYYNPAGIVFAFGRSLSGGAHAYHVVQKEYKDVLGGNGWERSSSEVIPNYFGIIQPLGRGKLGFSFAIPDAILEDQAQTFPNFYGSDPKTGAALKISRYVINTNDSDRTYNFGPTYGIKITERLSVGTTLYVHNRSRNFIFNQLLNSDDGRYALSNEYLTLSESGVRPVLGLMWTPVVKWSIGTKISTTYLFESQMRKQKAFRGLDYGSDPPVYSVGRSGQKRNFPFVSTLGIAYFPSERLLFSSDITHYTAAPYNLILRDEIAGTNEYFHISQESIFNIAIGAEYYLYEDLALRGGLYTNFANTPKLISGKKDQAEHIDMYGASISISRFARSTSLTMGGSYEYGTGKAQIISDDAAIQDVVMQSLTLFVSAAFNY